MSPGIRNWFRSRTVDRVRDPVGRLQADLQGYDVTAFATEFNVARLDVIASAPMLMSRAERLMLFSLAFGLRPRCYLEIGTFQGGSALIVAAALDALESDARMYCVDPAPQIAPAHWAQLQQRVQLFEATSPEIIPTVAAAAGMPFDMALIDGDHSYKGAIRDAEAVLPYMSHGSYVIFHDGFFVEVRRAIDDFVGAHPDQLVDFGLLTREITIEQRPKGGPLQWGGLRVVYVR